MMAANIPAAAPDGVNLGESPLSPPTAATSAAVSESGLPEGMEVDRPPPTPPPPPPLSTPGAGAGNIGGRFRPLPPERLVPPPNAEPGGIPQARAGGGVQANLQHVGVPGGVTINELTEAVASGNAGEVRYVLLRAGASAAAMLTVNMRPRLLEIAARQPTTAVLHELLRHLPPHLCAAELNRYVDGTNTLLHVAVIDDNEDLVCTILSTNNVQVIRHPSGTGDNIIHLAAYHGHVDLLRTMARYVEPRVIMWLVEEPNNNGETPLLSAANSTFYQDAVYELLLGGADPTARDYQDQGLLEKLQQRMTNPMLKTCLAAGTILSAESTEYYHSSQILYCIKSSICFKWSKLNGDNIAKLYVSFKNPLGPSLIGGIENIYQLLNSVQHRNLHQHAVLIIFVELAVRSCVPDQPPITADLQPPDELLRKVHLLRTFYAQHHVWPVPESYARLDETLFCPHSGRLEYVGSSNMEIPPFQLGRILLEEALDIGELNPVEED